MTPRTANNEERRIQILDAAMKIFSRDGFQKAKVDDIAKETGVAKGTLYLYFKSKDEIISTVVDQLFMGEFKEIDHVIAKDLSATDKLTSIFEIVIADYHKLVPLLPVMYEFYAYAMRKKTLKNAFSQYFNHYMDRLSTVIQEGIDQKEIKPCDSRAVAVSISAIFEGTLLLNAYIPNEIDLESHTRFGLQTLLAGLLIDSSK